MNVDQDLEWNDLLEAERLESEFRLRAGAEAGRVVIELEAITKEIELMIADTTFELSRVMRRKTEQLELNAYLRGIRYTIDGQL